MNTKQQAQQLKDNKLLEQIFADRDADIVQAWRTAQTTEEREKCSLDLTALEALRESMYARVESAVRDDEPRDEDAR